MRQRPSTEAAAAQTSARTTAVAYLRRSTDRQEQSIPDQRRAVEAYAADNGLRLSKLYVDDAISGTTTTRRRAFQQLMEDAQRPGCPFRYVVVYDVKRFGRVDNDEAGYYRHVLRMAGVEVAYVSENFNGDGTDDLLRPVKQWQAREESKDLSKVTIRGLLSKVGGGWWMGGVPPYGYDLRYEDERGAFLFVLRYMRDGSKQVIGADGEVTRTLDRGERLSISKRDKAKLHPSHPDRVEVIRRIFTMTAEQNRGYAAIAGQLNDDGVPTPRGPEWSRMYSGHWVSSTIREILVNPVYAGDMVWNRRTDGRFHKISAGQATERRDVYGARLVPNPEEDWITVPDAHPALIDRALFLAARRAREARAKRSGAGTSRPRAAGGWRGKRARYLLSGLVVCGRCGGRYEGCTRTKGKPRKDGTKVKTHYYGCGTYIRRGKNACAFGPIQQDVLEEAVIQAVVKFYDERYGGKDGERRLMEAIREATGAEEAEITEARAKARGELEDVQATIANLLDNISAANRELVDERLRELGARKERLGATVAELDELSATRVSERDVASEVRIFLGALEARLRREDPAKRIGAMRMCIGDVTIENVAEAARANVRLLPYVNAEVYTSRELRVRSQ